MYLPGAYYVNLVATPDLGVTVLGTVDEFNS